MAAETFGSGHTPVHVIGASGRSGLALCRAWRAAGRPLVPVVRDAGRWPGPEACRVADIEGMEALRAALTDASVVVSTAHARHAGAVIAAAPASARLVFLGSTRKFTRWPDDHGRGVLVGEAALMASGRDGVMLHPTMIYGAQGEDNVRRLARLLRRLPVVPLPGGGRSLVQPIHQDDVTRCVMAAADRAWAGPSAVVIAGPEPVTYAAFTRAVAEAAGLPPPRIVAMPAWLLRMGARVAGWVPGLPRVSGDEVRRLLEDKAFDVGPMAAVLGVRGVELAEGLARSF